MRSSARGHMEVGIPFAIATILAALVLSRYWAGIPTWASACGVVVVTGLALMSARTLGQPPPIARNIARERLAERRDASDDPGSPRP